LTVQLRIWTAFLIAAALVSIVAVVFRENWVFLWDGYGHRGIYRCSAQTVGDERIRQCTADVDETVFEERRNRDGTITRSWFVGGVDEYARTIKPPHLEEQQLVRRMCNQWWNIDADSGPLHRSARQRPMRTRAFEVPGSRDGHPRAATRSARVFRP